MPYSGISDASLPANVKRLPAATRKQWLAVFNSATAKGAADGDAIRQANGVVAAKEGKVLSTANFKKLQDALAMITTVLEGAGMMPDTTAKELKDFGIEVYDDQGQMRPVEAIVKEIVAKCGPEEDADEPSVEININLDSDDDDDDYAPASSAEPAYLNPAAGPTSFDEFDVMEEARRNAAEIDEQFSIYNQILRAIWGNDDLTSDDKVTAVAKAGTDFRDRVLNPPAEKSLVGRIKAALGGRKAIWTTAYVNNLPDSAFASVDSGGKKDADGKTAPRSLRHYPHHNAAGAVDLPHLRNALARAAQNPSGKDALGHLEMHAEDEKVGAGKGLSSFFVTKDRSGAYRWLGISTNKYEDREAETFAESAHREFVAHVDASKEFPELWLWHVPGSRVGVADLVEYADGFRVDSGTFDKGMEAVAERLAGAKDLAMSHGFHYQARDKRDGTFYRYRSFEDSVLPRQRAANIWTAFLATEVKEDMTLTKDKRDFLVDKLGEERVNVLEERLPQFAKELEERGVAWKDLSDLAADPEPPAGDDPKPEGDAPPAPDEGEEKEPANAITSENLSKVIGEAVGAALAPLSAELVAVKEKLAALEASDEEKIATKLAPRRPAPDDANRPTSSEKNVVEEDVVTKIFGEAVKENQPPANPAAAYVEDLLGGRLVRNGS